MVRNIKTTDDGKIVMAESGVNKIALVEVRASRTPFRVSHPRAAFAVVQCLRLKDLMPRNVIS